MNMNMMCRVASAFGGISRWLAVGCVMTARARGGVAWGCVIASRATRAVELRASQTLDRLPGSVLDGSRERVLPRYDLRTKLCVYPHPAPTAAVAGTRVL